MSNDYTNLFNNPNWKPYGEYTDVLYQDITKQYFRYVYRRYNSNRYCSILSDQLHENISYKREGECIYYY